MYVLFQGSFCICRMGEGLNNLMRLITQQYITITEHFDIGDKIHAQFQKSGEELGRIRVAR